MSARAYYSENDSFAAQWLRNLIARNLIMPGDVDERSIIDVKADDLKGYRQCHFFAGIGTWSYALRRAGWSDDSPEVWTASCPCQSLSVAGSQKGHLDERHLWPAFHALVSVSRPAAIIGEQVASPLGHQWLAGIRLDLEADRYVFGAADLPAAGAGAPHRHQRLFWVAYATDADRRPGICRPKTRTREDGERRWGFAGRESHGLLANSGVGQADPYCDRSSEGQGNTGQVRGVSEAECGPEHSPAVSWRSGSVSGMADADGRHEVDRELQRSGQHRLEQGDSRPAAGRLSRHCFEGSCCRYPNECDGNACVDRMRGAGVILDDAFVGRRDGGQDSTDRHERDGTKPRRPQGEHGPICTGEGCAERAGVAQGDASARGLGIDGSTSRRGGHADLADAPSSMGIASSPRSQGIEDRRGNVLGQGRTALERTDGQSPGPMEAGGIRPGAPNGFWADADWLRCRDGKWRAVEPRTFPLVDGAAFRLGSGSPFEGRSRAGELRGYGNAINAEIAAAFIAAAMEARP